MLEFIQIPTRDFYDKERTYALCCGGRHYIKLEHSSNTCEISELLKCGKIAEGTFVEEHGLVYIAVPEPIFYK